jgi:hypothetical protein
MNSKKFLIIRPKYGLCNQLYSISKGIVLGIISNRDIIFNGFQIDYRNIDNICNFNEIININHLQYLLDNNNLNLKVYSDINIDSKKIITNSELEISYIKDFIPLLFEPENSNEEYLDVDNPISFNIPNEYDHIIKYIDYNIKFTEKFINLSNVVKNKLNLDNYICLHLRLENDAINYIYETHIKDKKDNFNKNHVSEKCREIFKNEIEQLNNLNKEKNKIYICTSLIIDNNDNTHFYTNLKKKYNLIDKNDFIKLPEIKEVCNCREIYAIIDFLIAKDSSYFIGTDWSSFSIFIYWNHIYSNKNAVMIKLWEYFSKL